MISAQSTWQQAWQLNLIAWQAAGSEGALENVWLAARSAAAAQRAFLAPPGWRAAALAVLPATFLVKKAPKTVFLWVLLPAAALLEALPA